MMRTLHVVAMLFLISAAQAEEPAFTFEALPEFGFSMSRAHDVMPNDYLHIVGEMHDGQLWRPVLWWRNGAWQLVPLPIPQFTESDARALGLAHGFDDQLWIVGEVWVDVALPFPYLWKEESLGEFGMFELPHNGEGAAHGIAVSADITLIAGWTVAPPAVSRKSHDWATVWVERLGEDVEMQMLPGFDDVLPSMAHDASFLGELPVAVGSANLGNEVWVPTLWTCDAGEWFLHPLPLLSGGVQGQAHAISRPNGQHKIVGWSEDKQGLQRPVRWVSDDGFDWEVQALGPIASGEIHAVASSNGTGYHVGISSGRAGQVGTLWITNGVFQTFDLNTVVVGGPPAMALLTAHGVAANGYVYIVGDGMQSGNPASLGAEPHAYLLEQQLALDVPAVVASGSLPAIRAHPNPAGQRPSFSISLREDDDVVLTIHDPGGRLVARVLEKRMSAGDHVVSWNGRGSSGLDIAPGVYFARLQAGGDVVSSRVVIVH